jgi:hypothetical protein
MSYLNLSRWLRLKGALASIGFLALTTTAWAADPLSGLSAVGDGALGATNIGVRNSVLNLSGVDQSANVDHTKIVVTGNGQANTGQIADNLVQNNSGLTTFLANTGNNVSVNNSTILNIFLNPLPPAAP